MLKTNFKTKKSIHHHNYTLHLPQTLHQPHLLQNLLQFHSHQLPQSSPAPSNFTSSLGLVQAHFLTQMFYQMWDQIVHIDDVMLPYPLKPKVHHNVIIEKAYILTPIGSNIWTQLIQLMIFRVHQNVPSSLTLFFNTDSGTTVLVTATVISTQPNIKKLDYTILNYTCPGKQN